MLKVFNKESTDFSTLGLGVLNDFVDDPTITEVLNGEYYLEFTYKRDGVHIEHLIEQNIVVANGQAFRIINIKKNKNSIKILAKHIFFDLASNFLEDVAPMNQNAQNALDWILKRTQYPCNFVALGDCETLKSARYVRKNVIDAIYNEDNAVLKTFGGELELDNFTVKVHQKRGTNLGLDIRQGKNVTGAEYNLDFSTVATRIMPKGKDGLLLNEKYVDSELINNYFQPLIKMVEFNDIEDVTELKIAAKEMFKNGIDKPNVSIKIDFVELSKCEEYAKYQNLETAHLGDTCRVYIPFLNLDTNVRIVKTVYSCNLNRITKLELGSIKPNITTSVSAVSNSIEKMPTNLLSKAKEDATKMINHPFNGNIYIDEATGTLYLMDTNDINTAMNIWKWNLGGLGFSATGINGIFETAITQDGKIVADFISTGKLNTSLIEGYGSLVAKVENIVDTTNSVAGENTIILKNCVEGNLLELHIFGHNTDFNMLVPSDELYPSDDLFPVGSGASSTDTYVIEVENEDGTKETYNLGEIVLLSKIDDVQDEYVLKDGKASVIRRIDVENVEVQEEVIEELGEKTIFLKNGTNTITLLNYNAKISAKYVIKNTYTDIFATKTETNAQINIKANEVSTEVNSSVTSAILTLLNNGYLTAEQINSLVEGNTEEIATIKQQLKQTITDNQLQIAISTALEGGISYLKNTLFTINEEGMWIATSEDEFNALYNNKGMYLYSYNQMIAKFDVNGATMNNLKVEGTIETPHSKKMVVAVSGEERIYDFWID